VDSPALAASIALGRPLADGTQTLDTLVVGNRKPTLDAAQEATRRRRYHADFAAMVAFFTTQPAAGPADYPGDA